MSVFTKLSDFFKYLSIVFLIYHTMIQLLSHPHKVNLFVCIALQWLFLYLCFQLSNVAYKAIDCFFCLFLTRKTCKKAHVLRSYRGLKFLRSRINRCSKPIKKTV